MKMIVGEFYYMEVVDKVIFEYGYFLSEIVDMIKISLILELEVFL